MPYKELKSQLLVRAEHTGLVRQPRQGHLRHIPETQEAAQAQRDAPGLPRRVCLAAQVRVSAKMAELKAQLVEGVEVRHVLL